MKILNITILFILLGPPTIAQGMFGQSGLEVTTQAVAQSDESLIENLDLDGEIPKSRIEQVELLEEIKLKKQAIERHVAVRKAWGRSLESYRARVLSQDGAELSAIYSSINSRLKQKNNTSIRSLEDRILGKIQSLRYYYSTRGITDPALLSIIRDFSLKISSLLGEVNTDNILRAIIDRENTLEVDSLNVITSLEQLTGLKEVLTPQAFGILTGKLAKATEEEIALNSKIIDGYKANLLTIKQISKDLSKNINQEETQINDLAIKWGLPLFCLTILLLFLGPVLFKRSVPADRAEEVNSQNVLLEISTVLLLTMSILILGLSGKIASDVLGTLIGGISGYVLNRIRNRSDNAADAS